jgi:hypothetical protein
MNILYKVLNSQNTNRLLLGVSSQSDTCGGFGGFYHESPNEMMPPETMNTRMVLWPLTERASD